jgi:threonine dehydratase
MLLRAPAPPGGAAAAPPPSSSALMQRPPSLVLGARARGASTTAAAKGLGSTSSAVASRPAPTANRGGPATTIAASSAVIPYSTTTRSINGSISTSRKRRLTARAAAAAASSPSSSSSGAPTPTPTPPSQPPRPAAAASAASAAAAPPARSSASPGTTLDEQDEDVVDPDDLTLEPGVPSRIDRSLPLRPDDAAFRCPGCALPECAGPTGCAPTSWRLRPDGYLREALTARVYDVAVQTPLEPAQRLGESLGARILLKREDLQPVFSFKLRGAYNRMARLSAEQLSRGVITSSAGNHAQGVALAARRLGARAVICMPVATPEIKVSNVRRLGGEVALVGESYQEAQAAALSRAVSEGLTFIAPYDDPYTIAGQATIGDEILRQTDADGLDAIFVAVGGGGLAAGIAAYVKALKPNIKVFGVEPTGANAMAQSLLRGRRLTLGRVDAFADGVAVKQVGVETFRLCRELLDGIILVDNASISAAIKDVFNDTRSIVEPAGAVAVAGAKAWLQREHPLVSGEGDEEGTASGGSSSGNGNGNGGGNGGNGSNGGNGGGAAATTTKSAKKQPVVVAVTSGANMNFERLRLVSDLAALGSRAEAMFATTIPERPGSFRAFVAAATGVAIPSPPSPPSPPPSGAAAATTTSAPTPPPQNGQAQERGAPAPPNQAHTAQLPSYSSPSASASVSASASEGISVTEFKYRCSPGAASASVLWSATLRSSGAAAEIARRLGAAGLPTRDIGGMGLAQVHLRHLVGGRAAGAGGGAGAGAGAGGEDGGAAAARQQQGVPDERLFAATFPERPGALALFLGALSPEWNITLFHYRDTGNRESSVLLGLQLPPEQGAPRAFRRAVRSLGAEFAVEEVVGDEAEVFSMFIQ